MIPTIPTLRTKSCLKRRSDLPGLDMTDQTVGGDGGVGVGEGQRRGGGRGVVLKRRSDLPGLDSSRVHLQTTLKGSKRQNTRIFSKQGLDNNQNITLVFLA